MNRIRPGLTAALLVAISLSAAGEARAQFGGTTVQLPTFGVAIDAEGVLSLKESKDPGGKLFAARLAAAKAKLDADIAAPAKLRYVSLNRLEAAIEKKLKAGEEPDDAMQHLAGLTRVQYVMLLPKSRDVVIAGPAEGWFDDGLGHVIGVHTGRPMLELEDLLTALRMFPPGKKDAPFIGCTIDPTPEGLQRLVEFQKQVPRAVPQNARGQMAVQLASGTREALGMANVRVFGVPANTHLAKVLIEADYRMKLIGIGLEPPPVKMVTFLGALDSAPKTLQRWWFTPNYKCIRVADDRLAMELVGQGVQLQSEDKVIGPDGKLLVAGAPPSKASDAFTTSFTAKYPEIAAKCSVFAQMRNCIDLLVAAAFIQREDYYGRATWEARTLLDEKSLPTRTLHTPKQAPCAANSLWKGSRLLTPAGGGVSLLPHEALNKENVMQDDGSVSKARLLVEEELPADRWWWE
jgi:hypothetical protein